VKTKDRYGIYSHYPKNVKFLDLLGEELPLDRENLRILDAGCGTGTLTLWLSDNAGCGSKAFGVDKMLLSMLDRTRVDPANYVQGDLSALCFRDDSFDILVCNSVIEHIPHRLRRGAISEAFRVVKPGGVLVFGVPTTLHKIMGGPAVHEVGVWDLNLKRAELKKPSTYVRKFPNVVKLVYSVFAEMVEHLPWRWKRLFGGYRGKSTGVFCLNFISNCDIFVNNKKWSELERRVRARPFFRCLGTSIVFIFRK